MNAFTSLAERQISAPRKARIRAGEKRAARKAAVEQALAERDDLFRLWKDHRRAELDAALAGPHGQAIGRLLAFLDGMTFKNGAAGLIECLRSEDWRVVDGETRFLALRLVNQVITCLREKSGLPPIDDGLPGESPTAFQIVRGLLA
jgi:hypothetical protein